jgi:sirohydrochlorin ferrochelatase
MLAFCSAEASAQARGSGDDFGILVMAHGGGPTWNSEVEDMLAPLKTDYPLEIAFGMAEPETLQAAVGRLETQGVRRIAVVRLFISGESWLERTEQILGLVAGAPPRQAQAAHAGHGSHDMSLWRIETSAAFALSTDGLADAPEMGAVLVERARTLSSDPSRESILILAHGPEDDAENARWLARIDARAEALRDAAPYRRVQVDSLREDWPEKRAAAEVRIRAFVEQAREGGGRAIVIPYRVAGFGPYAGVLEGLDYASDGAGLLPSPQVGNWVRRRAETLRLGDFRRPLGATAP